MFAIIRINDTVESSIIYNFVKIQKATNKKIFGKILRWK